MKWDEERKERVDACACAGLWRGSVTHRHGRLQYFQTSPTPTSQQFVQMLTCCGVKFPYHCRTWGASPFHVRHQTNSDLFVISFFFPPPHLFNVSGPFFPFLFTASAVTLCNHDTWWTVNTRLVVSNENSSHAHWCPSLALPFFWGACTKSIFIVHIFFIIKKRKKKKRSFRCDFMLIVATGNKGKKKGRTAGMRHHHHQARREKPVE